MNDGCIITINDNDYFYPCDRRDYIIVVDGKIINTSTGSITLYSDFPNYNDNYSGYPRITLPSNSAGYYRSSYQSSPTQLNVNSMSFKTSYYGFDVYLMIVLIGISVINLFKR